VENQLPCLKGERVLKNNPVTLSLSQAEDPVLLASDWLVHSGIQDTSGNPKLNGGVSAWYDLKTKSYTFLYPEITGYAVNFLLFFQLILKDLIYQERARLAADWLIRVREETYGLIPNRVYHEVLHQPYYNSWVFTFDQWMIISGFCSLFEFTRDQVYLKTAEELAKLLIEKTFKSDGSMHPVFNLKTGQGEAANNKWSRQSGSFHAKALLGLSQLHKLTKEKEYLFRASQLARYALLNQEENGRFITQMNEKSTHLHPHLYSLEGLLSFGILQDDEKLIQACEKGLEWILNAEREDGTIYSFFKGGRFAPYERSDVLAQTLRIGAVLLERSEHIQKFKSKLQALKRKLLSYQVKTGMHAGGFFYGQEQNGTIDYHLNAWVTMFAAQALWLFERPQQNGSNYAFRFFV